MDLFQSARGDLARGIAKIVSCTFWNSWWK